MRHRDGRARLPPRTYAEFVYLENVVFDATDPQALGRFWEIALGTETLTDEADVFETRLAVRTAQHSIFASSECRSHPLSRSDFTSTSALIHRSGSAA